MNPIEEVKRDIEQLAGISDSDSEMFWALSRKCSTFALVPALAAGVKWGPGLVLTLPGLGTVSGTTAALIMMGGVWGSHYGACMSILPGLMQFRDKLRNDQVSLMSVRRDVWILTTQNRHSART